MLQLPGARPAGNEIVFVSTRSSPMPTPIGGTASNSGTAALDNSAQWIELARFRAGAERLLPAGPIEARLTAAPGFAISP